MVIDFYHALHTCGERHLHFPPTSAAKNGLAGSSLTPEYSGQLPGWQLPRIGKLPDFCRVAVGQHVSDSPCSIPSGQPSRMAIGVRPFIAVRLKSTVTVVAPAEEEKEEEDEETATGFRGAGSH